MSDLQKAVELLENNGFTVTRVYYENNRDAGNASKKGYAPIKAQERTGALCFRVLPAVKNAE